jgi:predicted lipoprotein with Yx(FWY)xxD motif
LKRICIVLTSVLVMAVAVTAVATAQNGVPAASVSRAAKVHLAITELGTILVNASGFTLYQFTRDHRNQDTCRKIKECRGEWPALRTTGKPIAGPGVHASLLSSITLPGGIKQVTYAGHALYIYSGDSGPGEVSYIGTEVFGGKWNAINAAGHIVTQHH